MNNLTRIKKTTENYAILQGLKWAPFAIWAIIVALGNAGILPIKTGFITKWQPFTGLLGISIPIVGWIIINSFYKNQYGIAQKSVIQRKREIIEGVVLLIIFTAAIMVDNLQVVPMSFFILACGGLFAYGYFQSNGLRKHMLWLALFFLPLTLLPMLIEGVSRQTLGNIFLFVFGTLWLVSALLDHWILLKTMSPVGDIA